MITSAVGAALHIDNSVLTDCRGDTMRRSVPPNVFRRWCFVALACAVLTPATVTWQGPKADASHAAALQIHFENRQKQSGVQFVLDNGTNAEKHIIDSVPGGVALLDFDNDGYVDVFITTLSNEKYALYRNNGDLSFTYVTNTTGVGQITLLNAGWGARFVDVDNDGLRDLFVAQSHVLDTVEKSTAYLKYKQPLLLMTNTGKGFANVSATAGAAFNAPVAARGAAFGDLNNDGQIDAVVNVLDDAPVILRNGGTTHHWIGIALSGTKSNRSGIGARVTVTDVMGKKQIFDVGSAGSYLSSNDPRIVVGLGNAKGVRSIEVRWPSGKVQAIPAPAIDRYLQISEPRI